MVRLNLLFMLFTTTAFAAQTECYFDNYFEDGTRGFFLEDNEITLMHRFSKFTTLQKDETKLFLNGEQVGKIKLFLPRGIIEIGQELSSFTCYKHVPRGRG